MFNTTCKFCVFSKKDESGKQIGCSVNRLDQWKSKNKASYNGDHYIIDDFCNMCRNKESFPDITEQEVKEQNYPTCSAFINIDLMTDIDYLVEYFKDKKYRKIHLIGNLNPLKAAEIYMKYNEKIKYLNVHSSLVLDFDSFILSKLNPEYSKGIRYFHIFDCNKEKTFLLDELDYLINKKLDKVILLYQKDNPSFIINCLALSLYSKEEKDLNIALDNIIKEGNKTRGLICVSQLS